jgi:2-dehydro-3-deoxyphosphogluconate aldolase/(4S)-4-hydroxy-2-oxoglutarate aldolase
MRENIIKSVEKEKIVVIVRGVERNMLVPLAEAMYEGGIRLMEITYDQSGKISDSETADRIAMLAEHFSGRMMIGAGTVVNESQVELTAKAGGGFIISPDTYRPVIERTRELSLVSMPGALTPTEVQMAHRFGADFVKLFPVSNLGVEYVKAIKAPLSNVKLLAVGGISLDDMGDYLRAGISGFGIGSNIIDKAALKSGDFDKITALARRYVEALSI